MYNNQRPLLHTINILIIGLLNLNGIDNLSPNSGLANRINFDSTGSKIFMASLFTDILVLARLALIEFDCRGPLNFYHADIECLPFLDIVLVLVPDMRVEVHGLNFLLYRHKLEDIFVHLEGLHFTSALQIELESTSHISSSHLHIQILRALREIGLINMKLHVTHILIGILLKIIIHLLIVIETNLDLASKNREPDHMDIQVLLILEFHMVDGLFIVVYVFVEVFV